MTDEERREAEIRSIMKISGGDTVIATKKEPKKEPKKAKKEDK